MTTAQDVLKRAKHYVGTREHPPGSNHVPGITDHFGNGSWCFMFVSTVFNDIGAIDLIHGWHAYVPDFYSIFHPHGEYHTSNPKPGDLVSFDFNRTNSPEHIGIVYKVISSTVIQTIEGNTGGSGGDGVYIKTRSRSDVFAYATPKYSSTSSGDDDLFTEYVSVTKTDKSREEELTSGEWHQVYFDRNDSAAADKEHSDKGDFPSLVTGPGYFMGVIGLRITGLPKGTECQLRMVYTDAKTSETKSTGWITEFQGSDGDTFVEKVSAGSVPKDTKLRIEVVHYGPLNVKPKVIRGQAHIFC